MFLNLGLRIDLKKQFPRIDKIKKKLYLLFNKINNWGLGPISNPH